MTRARLLTISLTLVVLLGAACGGGAVTEPPGAGNPAMDQPQEESNSSSPNEIALRGIAFVPATLTVEPGTEVSWVNIDDVDHTVTSGTQREQGVPGVEEDKPAKPDGMFDEAVPGSGDSFDFTFDEPGTYAYYCDVHAGMTGEITVE